MSKESRLERRSKEQLSWPEIWSLTKTIFAEYFSESSFRHAAALSYYALFSLIPLLYLTVYFFGRFLGNETVFHLADNFFQNQIGMEDTSGIMELLKLYDVEKRQPFMEIASIFVLLFVSTAFLTTLRESINDFLGVAKVKVSIKKEILRTVISRLLAIVFTGSFGVIIILMYVGQTVLIALGKDFINDSSLKFLYELGLPHIISISSNFLIFTLLFKYVHDARVRWKSAILGGLLTAILVYFGQIIIKYYLTHFFLAANGGIVGSVLVILAWIFYTGQIIFLGAKFVKIYSKMIGHPIQSRFIKINNKVVEIPPSAKD